MAVYDTCYEVKGYYGMGCLSDTCYEVKGYYGMGCLSAQMYWLLCQRVVPWPYQPYQLLRLCYIVLGTTKLNTLTSNNYWHVKDVKVRF